MPATPLRECVIVLQSRTIPIVVKDELHDIEQATGTAIEWGVARAATDPCAMIRCGPVHIMARHIQAWWMRDYVPDHRQLDPEAKEMMAEQIRLLRKAYDEFNEDR